MRATSSRKTTTSSAVRPSSSSVPEAEAAAPARRLGLPTAAGLVVANTVGAGVFTTSGFALADLGRPSLVLLAWAVGGAIALCGALSYAALARRIPESGGEYTFLSRNVHPLAGFLAGWVSLLAGFTAPIAVAGLALEAYVASALPVVLPPTLLGSTAILLAAAMHAQRLALGSWLQNLAVAGMLAAILGFVVAGALRLGSGGPGPEDVGADAPFELGAFAVTLVWISFSYAGWNAAVYLGGEVRDPERVLTRAVVGGTLLVIAIYLALNAVFVFAAPVSVLAGRPDVGAAAAEAIGGAPLARALSGIVALALFTSISSMIMAGPRVYARMAQDGVFPAWLTRGREVPTAAVTLQAGLAIGLVQTSGLIELLGYIGFVLGLSSAATVCSLGALRLRLGAAVVPVFGWPLVPALFVTATLVASCFLALRAPEQAAAGLVSVGLGIPVYFFFARRRG